jgi:cysteine desulfurase/selenocysteine lyase
MRELCHAQGIALNEDYSVKPVHKEKIKSLTDTKKGETIVITPDERTAGTFDAEKIRRDFPILTEIIYLDNAATSFSPEPVVQAVVDFEHQYRANIGRGVHRLTQIASQRYWHAHEKVAQFIGGQEGVTVFTKNTTEAINMVAQGLSWKRGDHVVTTILEHHSNLLPWRNLTKQGVRVDLIGINTDYSLDLSALENAITDTTKLVAITHASNVLGVITPIEKIAEICHDHGSLLLVDGAQTVPHMPVDVMKLKCDFLAFSGHKMLGPTGTGVLWMKEPVIEPTMLGGGMVETVTKDGYTAAEGYQKYEAGTPNISGGIGLGAAVDYLRDIGMDEIRQHEERLTSRMVEGLKNIGQVHVYAPDRTESRIGVVSFTIDGIHPHEVAQQLDENADIMVRSGHHCCQPLMDHLGLAEGTVRASLALYNIEQEIDLLLAAVDEIVRGL